MACGSRQDDRGKAHVPATLLNEREQIEHSLPIAEKCQSVSMKISEANGRLPGIAHGCAGKKGCRTVAPKIWDDDAVAR